MPFPGPSSAESREEWIERCMGDSVMQQEYNPEQRLAICGNLWENKDMNPNDKLLAAVRARQQKQTEFGYGILTADSYVKSLRDCVGSDICYRFACAKGKSFQDVIDKAAQTLVYSNPEMMLEDKRVTSVEDVELPKNTLMVFKHVLTTPRKDRDGDVLRTEGAEVDPKMLLLWQHVHTLPIGKMVAVAEHNSNKLSLISAIVDMNELCHDSAVMVDNDMGRFSHGFRVFEMDDLKEEEGNTTGSGFDVKRFEIMEESLVSVPSNTDAGTEEVLMSLVSSGKLTSPIMKEVGKNLKDQKPVQVGVEYREKLGDYVREIVAPNAASFKEVFEESNKNANESTDGSSEEREEKRECTCPPKEADAGKAETKETQDAEVTMEVSGEELVDMETSSTVEEKAGASLSRRNLQILKDVKEDLEELSDRENLSRAGNALCKGCVNKLGAMIEEAGGGEEEEDKEVQLTAKDAAAVIFASSQKEQRLVLDTLQQMEQLRKSQERTKRYRNITGR